ncbi:MAG TPA: antibiotic biosynthesis monooxygenase [Vicinamibacterales bacterium]|nr:antibiotic biosynthesis monooxygenase [Vicinamibacterales bacterium]
MPGYTYVWEFFVAAEHAAEFERMYGPDGEWVALFRRARGYVGSTLHRDRANPQRYVTVDSWQTAGAWERFRTEYSAEFEALDAQGRVLTVAEREVGRFDAVGENGAARSTRPLAEPGVEAQARRMMADGVSPDEYAARWSHRMGTFSMDEFSYREPEVEAWVHRLGAILFRRPGAPRLADLRARYLTDDEREAIRDEEASGEG